MANRFPQNIRINFLWLNEVKVSEDDLPSLSFNIALLLGHTHAGFSFKYYFHYPQRLRIRNHVAKIVTMALNFRTSVVSQKFSIFIILSDCWARLSPSDA